MFRTIRSVLAVACVFVPIAWFAFWPRENLGCMSELPYFVGAIGGILAAGVINLGNCVWFWAKEVPRSKIRPVPSSVGRVVYATGIVLSHAVVLVVLGIAVLIAVQL